MVHSDDEEVTPLDTSMLPIGTLILASLSPEGEDESEPIETVATITTDRTTLANPKKEKEKEGEEEFIRPSLRFVDTSGTGVVLHRLKIDKKALWLETFIFAVMLSVVVVLFLYRAPVTHNISLEPWWVNDERWATSFSDTQECSLMSSLVIVIC